MSLCYVFSHMTASSIEICGVNNCRNCLWESQCLWHLSGMCMERDVASKTSHSRDLIMYEINCPMVRSVHFTRHQVRYKMHRQQPIKNLFGKTECPRSRSNDLWNINVLLVCYRGDRSVDGTNILSLSSETTQSAGNQFIGKCAST